MATDLILIDLSKCEISKHALERFMQRTGKTDEARALIELRAMLGQCNYKHPCGNFCYTFSSFDWSIVANIRDSIIITIYH